MYNMTCPACGYKTGKMYNIASETRGLLKERNKETIKYLNKIASKITSNIPSETRVSYFQFLFGIKSIDDHIVASGIEDFYQRAHYLSGKGFAYLRKIIQNKNENIGTLRKNERLLLGSTPPVIEIKE
jgi:hypothetical protein|tara:strand:+ start:192 stop:575 length:384 start_codon:yes stop_codon:yes gene_type:complete